MKAPTREEINEWIMIFQEYGPKLRPNRKSAAEVVEYLKAHYPLAELNEESFHDVICGNITGNECYAEKIPAGADLAPEGYKLENESEGARLYRTQDPVYGGCRILVGVEHQTNLVFVEGSDELTDEIVAFQGLDEFDLNNFFLVARYVQCAEKYGLLQKALGKQQTDT